MVQTVNKYPDPRIFVGHSILTLRLITMGRVSQCSKGFLPQVKRHNHWINISASLDTFEAARNLLINTHCKEAATKRGWSDDEMEIAKLKAAAKDLKMWSDRLQKRMSLQKQLEENLPDVELQASELLRDPATSQLPAKALIRIVQPLCEAVFFCNQETTKTGNIRTLHKLLDYCNDSVYQKQKLDILAGVS